MDPENAYTHSNYGWNLLEKGDYKKARTHFEEALKANPNLDFAQAGMLESIKAGNPFYRLFLNYSFWIGNLQSKGQWAFIIGFYVVFRILKIIARNNEGLQPLLFPLLFGLALVALSTWVISPIGNLFLRFNKYGQLLLDKKEKTSSNFVAIAFGVFICGILVLFMNQKDLGTGIAAFGFTMMIPFSVMLVETKPNNVLLYYTILLAIIGFAGILNVYWSGELFNTFTSIYILGIFIFQWVSNYFMIKSDNP